MRVSCRVPRGAVATFSSCDAEVFAVASFVASSGDGGRCDALVLRGVSFGVIFAPQASLAHPRAVSHQVSNRAAIHRNRRSDAWKGG